MPKEMLNPVHPGEVLLEEFLKPLGISQNKLALSMRVSPRRINEIVLGKRGITAETALRLSRCLNTTPEFWMSLQDRYDLDVARISIGDRLEREVNPCLELATA